MAYKKWRSRGRFYCFTLNNGEENIAIKCDEKCVGVVGVGLKSEVV